MNLIDLFPTTVGMHKDIHMANIMLPVAKKYLEDNDQLNKTFNYKTTYDTNQNFSDEINFFATYFESVGNNFLNSLGYASLDFKAYLFFSEMFKGDFHQRHAHPNSFLSGVFYLQVPEGSSNIKFYDPSPYKEVFSLNCIDKENSHSWDSCEIKPEVGTLLIWRSFLKHEVLINNSNDGRITAVFNLNI